MKFSGVLLCTPVYTKNTKKTCPLSPAKSAYQTLYKEREDELRQRKIKQVHEIYELYDKGTITAKEFGKKVVEEADVKTKESFDIWVNRANEDKKSFTEVVKNLDIFENGRKTPSTPQSKRDESRYYPKYKHLQEPKKTVDNDEVKENINKFVRGEIGSGEFKNILTKNNVNTKSVEIDKVFRDTASGKASFASVASAISKYRDSKNVVRDNNYFKESSVPRGSGSDLSDKKLAVPCSWGSGTTVKYLAKKKTFSDVKMHSHKDHFNWEGNVKSDFEKNIYNEKKVVPPERQKANDDKSKKNKSTFLLTWGGAKAQEDEKIMNNNKNYSNEYYTIGKAKTIGTPSSKPSYRKRDPNAQSMEIVSKDLKGKNFTRQLHRESKDFTLTSPH